MIIYNKFPIQNKSNAKNVINIDMSMVLFNSILFNGIKVNSLQYWIYNFYFLALPFLQYQPTILFLNCMKTLLMIGSQFPVQYFYILHVLNYQYIQDIHSFQKSKVIYQKIRSTKCLIQSGF
ncbi:unnamed protein product [Paramecium sonneborni]|uniref:Transmembrane protein n=1 Tax=Paramecium sonneborni TaxID=65129 RepID=A0A8S1KT55_9CILI|nr:unnamed protein product [Paramecium sonneborni]